MTNWNKYGHHLFVEADQDIDDCRSYLETLSKNIYGKPLWGMDEDGFINPISCSKDVWINPILCPTETPKDYILGYLYIVKWLKKRDLNHNSGYAFTYDYLDNISVGGINSNNKGVTFCQIHGDGEITQKFYKLCIYDT